KACSGRAPGQLLGGLRLTPGRVARSAACSRYSISLYVMMLMIGSASRPPDDMLKSVEYVPFTRTFAPTAGSGLGRLTPHVVSECDASSLPLSYSLMAS